MESSSPPPSRRQRTRQATIAAILDAARAQMRAEGAGALNLNELARQVGMRPPSLYEYFPGGKHAIYDALFALGFELFSARMQLVYDLDDPWEQLRQSIETYLDFAIANPELYQICFERPVPGFVPSEASLAVSLAALERARAATEGVLGRLGGPAGATVDQTRDLVIVLMHGIAALHLANEPHLPPDQSRFGSLIPAAVNLLRRSWSADPERPASSEGGNA